jgi:lipopolysaccharide export system ATP-binding protein
MSETVLRGEHLVKEYGRRTVVNDVSIEVRTGEVVGLLGPNGAGKTTTFYMVTGMIRPNSGAVFLGEREITGAPMYQRARDGIGYLPQEASVFRKLSVEDNLRLICETLPLSKTEQEEKLESLLEELSITHVRKNRGNQLSGGERRRAEIARALVTDPDFILLDEPFAGVDPIAVEDIQQIVLALKTKGIGNPEFEAGVISLRKLSSGFISFGIKSAGNASVISVINNKVLNDFEKVLIQILEEIFDRKIPFTQTENRDICKLCNFKGICARD